MGNAMNNPLDDAKQERMKEIIAEVVGEFSKQFPLKYKDALIEKLKEEAQPEEEDNRLLPDAPVPDYELKKGMMVKRGDIRKNWKSRFFVALNEADNYRIDYFEKEDGKVKGSIHCCGYNCEEFNEDETVEFGQFGIKLVPYDDRRRTWYFRCENEDEKNEWMKVFNAACRKARPPVNDDIVMRKAFRNAYRAVRWHYGYWGWYSITGTEAETLGGLCCDIVNRELINDVIYNIPAGPQRNFTVSLLRKTVDAAIVSAVSAAWNSSVAACESLKSTLESSVRQLLSPLFEQEVKIKEEIKAKVGAKINPFMEDSGKTILRPVMKVASSPITKAFCAAINGLSNHMKKQIQDGSFSSDSFANAIRWTHRSVEYWYSGPLEETNRILWKIYTSDLADVASFFSGGFTAYSVYSDVLDAIRDLTHRAIYWYETQVNEGNTNHDALLSQCLGRMVHDAKIAEHKILNNILSGILRNPLESTIISPCMELVQPVQDFIDAIPIPGLSDLFNLAAMVEEVLWGIVDGAIESVTTGSMGDVESQIEAAGSAVGAPRL